MANLVTATAGMLYRFNPAGFAFIARPGAIYFPSAIEIIISLGFVAAAIMGYLYAVKKFAILPAPTSEWFAMESDPEFASFVRPEVNAASCRSARLILSIATEGSHNVKTYNGRSNHQD